MEFIWTAMKRIILLVHSVGKFLCLKVRYGKRVQLKLVNSIKGKLSVVVEKGGALRIGKFLMSAGPTYLKCCEKARMDIGDNVFFNHNCSVTAVESIRIGDGCNIANNVVIVDHDHNIDAHGVTEGLNAAPVSIGKNVWLGANVVILKGVSIGDGAIVAAGAVVNKNIPSYELWGGGVPPER